MTVAGIGHNGGPDIGPGVAWRRHCWAKARADLLPHLPIEVLRGRVKRAQELGLDYKTYASVRASTGHDVIGFLFSSNALRLLAPKPVLTKDRADKLAAIVRCGRIALVQRPLVQVDVERITGGLLDSVHPAPLALASWAEARGAVRAALGKVAPDGVILIGDMALERDWCAAGRLAAYVPADRYFAEG